ncbi:MAG: DUF58 domain-containing protein [Pseudomonadota bacterium]
MSARVDRAIADEEPLVFDDGFLKKLERLQLISQKIAKGALRGEHATRRRGRGSEFTDFRAYRPGDEVRHIDWNISSRLDRLFLKLFASEEDLTLHLLLDTSESMAFGTPSKFDHARRVCAALAIVGLSHFDRVSISPFNVALQDGLPPVKSRTRIASVLDFLRQCRPEERTDFETPLTEFSSRPQRPGLVIVVSDLLGADNLFRGLDALRWHQHDVVVLQLLSDEEVTPQVDGVLRLIDAETGDDLRLVVDAELRRLYETKVNEYFRTVEAYCRRTRAAYFRAQTSIPFEDIVLKYFRQAAYLR